MERLIIFTLWCSVILFSWNLVGAERIKLLPDALQSRTEKLVQGGRDAVFGEFPFQVSIQIIGDREIPDGHICGGSILNEYTVLTAAHCFDTRPLKGHHEIVAGANVLKGPHEEEQRRLIDRLFIHPKYTQIREKGETAVVNDIAIVRLRVPFIFNYYVYAAKLPQADVYPQGDVQVSGWGNILKWESARAAAVELQVADLPLLSSVECEAQILVRQRWRAGDWVKSFLCTKPLFGNVTPWKGDSGGPLSQNGVVVGIISTGDDDSPLAIYTRVSAFLKWINSKMLAPSNNNSKANHEL